MCYEEQLIKIEYYIVEHYNDYILGIFNLFRVIILGIFAFLTIWVILPVISALCILCVCSIVAESYSMIKNTGLLIKNMYGGVVSDVKMCIDCAIVMFTIYYLCSILLNSIDYY
jgi:hypothetical protein